MSSSLLSDLQARGLLAQQTAHDELNAHLDAQPRAVYCGFDPTADSLHIGSLVPLLALRRFQLAGHRPIALVGGATDLIGDPSFKASERSLNSQEVVAQWAESLRGQVSQYIDLDHGPAAGRVVNNYDWMAELDIITFLRDVGKHFSVNAMIQKESVKQRIGRDESGISFTEFTYMILQSYDFAKLNELHDCSVQIGGSDQWGNITGGIDLTRRLNRNQVFGVTLPLITKSDGTKFGKTESGTIWLDANKTSPYAFYQFWINTADADVYRFLRYFTFLTVAEIEAIEAADQASTGKPEAQAILAREVTRLVHGEAGYEAALRISQALFSGDLSQLTASDMAQLALDGLPSTQVSEEISLVDALINTGLAPSRRQAREFIGNGAVLVNGVKVNALDANLALDNALFDGFHLLRRGKKQFHLIRWSKN